MTLRIAEKTVARLTAALAAERERLGISQREVAKRAGLDPKTISFIERGQRSPTLLTLLLIAGAMDASLPALLSKSIFHEQ